MLQALGFSFFSQIIFSAKLKLRSQGIIMGSGNSMSSHAVFAFDVNLITKCGNLQEMKTPGAATCEAQNSAGKKAVAQTKWSGHSLSSREHQTRVSKTAKVTFRFGSLYVDVLPIKIVFVKILRTVLSTRATGESWDPSLYGLLVQTQDAAVGKVASKRTLAYVQGNDLRLCVCCYGFWPKLESTNSF